jgi:hypothetical protein
MVSVAMKHSFSLQGSKPSKNCSLCADPTSGVSMDWVRGVFNKPYTYTWELRDTGNYGFLLPASQIIDTAEETINSVVVILQHAKENLRRN